MTDTDITLEKGMYRLTENVANPKPDRRQRYDWRARVIWMKGEEYEVVDTILATDLEVRAIRQRDGRWSHYMTYQHEEIFKALAPKLELIRDHAAQLDTYHSEIGATRGDWRTALILLIRQGIVTMDEAEAALIAARDTEL